MSKNPPSLNAPTAVSANVVIIAAMFNADVTDRLLEVALNRLLEAGVKEENISVDRVPGAFELPLAAQAYAEREDVAAILLLGAVIRGETAHFEYIARAAAEGATRVSLDSKKPVIFGVLTTDTLEQAEERIPQAKYWANSALAMTRFNDEVRKGR